MIRGHRHARQQRRSRLPSMQRLVTYLLSGVLLIGLVGIGSKSWRIYNLVRLLQTDVQALKQQDWTSVDQLEPALTGTNGRLAALYSEVLPLRPLLPLLAWFPRYGADIAAAPALLDAATDLTTAVDATQRALLPLAPLLDDPTAVLTPAGVAQLTAARPALQQAHSAAIRARTSWASVPLADLSPEMRTRLEQIAPLVPLLEAATSLSLAAQETAVALSPLLDSANAADGTSLIANVRAAQPELQQARQALDDAIAVWDTVPLDQLPGEARGKLEQVGTALPIARDGVDLALVLPELLGAIAPQHYLVVLQNSDEIRATGGFISGVVTLTLDQGQIAQFAYADAVAVDDLAAHAYPAPPRPLDRYMGIELLLFRDANWSPDFPTSAQVLVNLYAMGQGQPVDHVIAINPRAVAWLLEATEPITIAELSQPIAAANLMDYLRFPERFAPTLQREQAKELLARALVERLTAREHTHDRSALGRALWRALDQRELLVHVTQPEAQAMFARRGWDGAVQAGASDFVMVVNSDMGYAKVAPNITEAISYTVDMHDPTAPIAELTIQHTNQADGPSRCIHVGSGDTTYAAWMQRCYWNYLRVLAPRQSQLLSAQTNATPGAWLLSGVGDDGTVHTGTGAHGTRMFSTFLVVPQGEQRETTLHYLLPADMLTWEGDQAQYRLRVQKQAGVAATTFRITIRLPPEAQVISVAAPAHQEQDHLVFTGTLERDIDVAVTFRLKTDSL